MNQQTWRVGVSLSSAGKLKNTYVFVIGTLSLSSSCHPFFTLELHMSRSPFRDILHKLVDVHPLCACCDCSVRVWSTIFAYVYAYIGLYFIFKTILTILYFIDNYVIYIYYLKNYAGLASHAGFGSHKTSRGYACQTSEELKFKTDSVLICECYFLQFNKIYIFKTGT